MKPTLKIYPPSDHAEIAEPLVEPLAERIAYVLRGKPQEELTVRFAAMRPMLDAKDAADAYAKAAAKADAYAACVKSYDRDWPKHPPVKDGAIC